MPGDDGFPITEMCFLGLAMVGDVATAAQIRRQLALEGDQLKPSQVHTSLQWLARKNPPLIEVVPDGPRGQGHDYLYRLTSAGRARLCEE